MPKSTSKKRSKAKSRQVRLVITADVPASRASEIQKKMEDFVNKARDHFPVVDKLKVMSEVVASQIKDHKPGKTE